MAYHSVPARVELHLSPADMGRIRLAPQASFDTELQSSLRLLRGRPHPCFTSWRDSLPIWHGNPRSLASYQKIALDPWWDRIETLIAADRAKRTTTLLDGGLDALLTRLHPQIRWRSPVLEVSGGPQSVSLDGRGLILQPSVFSFRSPEIVAGPGGQPVLIYPVSCEIDDPRQIHDVSPLIGRTRASVLKLLLNGAATTTELAHATGLSMAAMSQHVGVLRESGMVVTQALGRSRCHSLTAAGVRLLGLPECKGTATH